MGLWSGRFFLAELVSKPQLPVPGSSCGCSTAPGWVPASCWAVKSGWEHFSQCCAFPASPARSRGGPVAGQPLPRALCSAGCVQSSAVRDSFELLLSYLAPKPQPRSQTRCSPAFPLCGACVGRQALPGARKRAAGEGGSSPPLLLPRLKDSPGIRREVRIKSPPYLLLQSVPVSLGSWKGLNQVFSPGEMLRGLERQP